MMFMKVLLTGYIEWNVCSRHRSDIYSTLTIEKYIKVHVIKMFMNVEKILCGLVEFHYNTN